MAEKIRILHVLAGGGIGGAERFLERFVRFVDTTTFINEFIFLYSGGAIESAFRTGGYKTKVLNWGSGFSLIGRLLLIATLNKSKPDVIHFHDSTPLVKCFVRIFFNKTPIIQTVHGITINSNFARWGQTVDDRFIDLVISNSEYTSREYSETYHRAFSSIKKIYLGVDLNEYQNNVWANFVSKATEFEGKINLIYLGRLEEYKGILDLPILAKKLLSQGITDFKIKVVGDGSCRNQFLRLMADLEVEHFFEYCGLQIDTVPLLVTSDILVFPSWWEEPLGLVLLEAIACGLAIVAYDSGAVSEVLNDFPCTRIVKKKDVDELAKTIKDMVINPCYPDIDECKRFLQKRFDIQKTVLAIEEVYEESVWKREKQSL